MYEAIMLKNMIKKQAMTIFSSFFIIFFLIFFWGIDPETSSGRRICVAGGRISFKVVGLMVLS